MAETSTAQDSTGRVTVASPPEDPTPRSAEGQDSESNDDSPKSKARKKSPITSKAAVRADGVEVDNRGVVRTKWDNPAADPNSRKHIGESPNGEGNEIEGSE